MTAEAVDVCGTERGYARHRRRGETPCPSCVSAHTTARRDRRYGLQPGEYDAMLARQGGRCYICGATPSRPLVVDHDHRTGAVRALLCHHCNVTLGHALESTEILRRAVLYLEGNLREAPDRFLGDLSVKDLRRRFRKPSGALYKARGPAG